MENKTYTAKEIEAKYKIGSSTLNRWVNTLKDLGLTIGKKVNRKPIYSEEDIKEFNALKAHLDSGGKTKDYCLPLPTQTVDKTPWDSQTFDTKAIEPTIPPNPIQSQEFSPTELALIEVINKAQESRPLEMLEVIEKKYQILESFAERGIQLPSKEIKALIDKNPSGDVVDIGSYLIVKTNKAAGKNMWIIKKKDTEK